MERSVFFSSVTAPYPLTSMADCRIVQILISDHALWTNFYFALREKASGLLKSTPTHTQADYLAEYVVPFLQTLPDVMLPLNSKE